MKQRWIALLLAAVLTAAMVSGALAAVVENDHASWDGNVSTPGVNSDPEAQAEMLRQLGLFLGTDNGFDLDKPLTRPQAAAMLTRLLGGETDALERNPVHPFTDVPQWASPYVGWLYEQGLTKGVGGNLYGAHRNITFEEYATMLVRTLWGAEDRAPWFALSMEGSSESEQPFTRGVAVGLTVRALGMPSAVQEGRTLLQLLHEQSVFSSETLEAASWGVIAPRYETDAEGTLCRTVGGVTVATCPEQGFTVVEGTAELDQDWFLATRRERDGLTVARLNCRTLEVEAAILSPDPNTIRMELVPEEEAPADGLCVAEVLKNGSDIRYGKIYLWRDTGLETVGTAEALWGADKLPPDGEALAPIPAEGSVSMQTYGEKHTVTAERLADGSLRIAMTENASGTVVDTYTIAPTDYDGDGVRELPSVRLESNLFCGTAGAYHIDGDRLVQLTDLPTLDVQCYDWRVGYHCLTYTPGVSPVVQGRQTGDELWEWDLEKESLTCILPRGHGIRLTDLGEGTFRGFSPDGLFRSYFYTYNSILGTCNLWPSFTQGVEGLESSLAYWWEESRLAGLGLA